MTDQRFVRDFSEIGLRDVPLVGGKNASLGEMYRELDHRRHARAQRLRRHRARPTATCSTRRTPGRALHAALDGPRPGRRRRSGAPSAAAAREIVYGATLPAELAGRDPRRLPRRCVAEYGAHADRRRAQLGHRRGPARRQLRRPARDLPQRRAASAACSTPCRRCFASLFTDRAIHYRIDQGFDHFKVFLSVGVMKMVRADLAASGVIFTLDTESGFRDVGLRHRPTGWARTSCRARWTPTSSTSTSRRPPGYRAVLRRRLGDKADDDGLRATGGPAHTTRNVPTPQGGPARASASPTRRSSTLADAALGIEDHYSAGASRRRWTSSGRKDGVDGLLYIVQARPETVVSQRSATLLEEYGVDGHGRSLVRGPVGRQKIADGRRPRVVDRARAAGGVPSRRGAGRRHHHARLGAGDEDGRRRRHQPRRAHLPRGDRRARARHPGGGGRRRRDRDACAPATHGHGVVRRGRHRPASTRASAAVPRRRAPTCPTWRARRPRSWSTSAIPTWPSRPRCCPTTASAWRAWSSSSAESHQGASDGAGAPGARDRRRGARGARAPDPRLRRRPAEFFVRAARRGRRHHRGGLLPTPVIVRHVGLQDQRVREPARRAPTSSRTRRTRCSASAAPRATRTRPTPRGSRSSARRCAGCARRWGSTTSKLMIPFCRRVEEAERCSRAMAELRPEARRERARGLRDVRDPEQRRSRSTRSPSCSTASRSARTTSRS